MDIEKEVKKAMIDMEMTFEELAVELEMTSDAVRKALKRKGISLELCKNALDILGKELKVDDK